MQISPYVSPAATPRIGKRRMGNLHTSCKWSRKMTTNTRKEEEVEEIRDTKGHSEEEQVWKTDSGTEPTTSADSTPTVATGDDPISQVWIILFL